MNEKIITGKTIAIFTAYAHKLPKARPELLSLLQDDGNRLIVLGLEEQCIGDTAFNDTGIKYVSISLGRHRLSIIDEYNATEYISSILTKNNVDLLLSYGIRLVVSANHAAKKSRIPVVNIINGAGNLFVNNGVKGKILRAAILPALRVSFSYSSRVIFQNSDDKSEFERKGLVDKNKSRKVNGSGVNLQKYIPLSLPDKKVFGIDCRLSREKGILELIMAFKKLKREMPDIELKIAGGMDGIENTEISSFLLESVADGDIEYLGETDNVIGFLGNCRCFVYPSYYREGVPRSIIEAMACGRPIITTDMPGCRETVIDNGYLVSPRNVDELYKAMKRICSEDSKIEYMGSRSRQIAESKFDVDTINNIIGVLLAECVRNLS